MINNIVLVGRLTKDPELRYTPNGVATSSFTLAVNRNFKAKNGEQEADFIQCVTWQKQAENVANFLKKGSLVGVTGRIQTRNYENNEGKRVYVTEIMAESVQFLEPKNAGSGTNGTSQGNNNNQKTNNSSGNNSSNNNRNNNGNNNGNKSANQGYSGRNSNYTRVDDDPFANSGGKIDISDDDLPF